MNGKYPKTLRAVRAEEVSSWEVAFALIDEIPSDAGLGREIERCAKALDEAGFRREVASLRKLRGLGAMVPKAKRSAFEKFPISLADTALRATDTPGQAIGELRRAKRDGETRRAFHKRLTGRPYRPSETSALDASPEVKRETFARLARDPDVVEDLGTRATAQKALDGARQKETARSTAKARGADATVARSGLGLVRAMSMFDQLRDGVRELGEIWRDQANAWTEEERTLYVEAWDEVVTEVEWTSKALETGDWDAALAALSEEG